MNRREPLFAGQEVSWAPIRKTKNYSIAAIIPLYNGAWCIEEAIRSVFAQTRPPDEFIVVDDGSTDDGPDIVERLAKEQPIQLFRKGNGGQSSARNLGVRHSTSTFIAFLDQDDRWYPNHLEDLLRAAKRHRGLPLGWVYSDFDDVDEHGNMVRRSYVDHVTNPKRDLLTILREGIIIQPSATLISREAFEKVCGFDERLSGYEDDDLFLRIFRANFDNIFIKQSTSQWRIHNSSSATSDRHDNSLRIYIQKLLGSFPDDPHRGHCYARHAIAPRFIRVWLSMYLRAWRYRNYEKMKEYAADALSLTKYLQRHRSIACSLAFRLFQWPWFGVACLTLYHRVIIYRRPTNRTPLSTPRHDQP